MMQTIKSTSKMTHQSSFDTKENTTITNRKKNINSTLTETIFIKLKCKMLLF